MRITTALAMTAALLFACTSLQAQSLSSYGPILPAYYVAARTPAPTNSYIATATPVATTNRYAPSVAPAYDGGVQTTHMYPLYEASPESSAFRTSGSVLPANFQTAPRAVSPTPSPTTSLIARQPAAITPTSPYYTSPAAAAQPVPVQVSAPITVASAGQVIGDPCACSPVAVSPVYYSTTAAVSAPAATSYPYGYGYGGTQHQVAYAGSSQLPPGVVFGRGVLFQPVVYVPGQPVRNLFRWLTP